MKVVFIQVGKTSDRRLNDFVAEYAARVGRYVPFEIATVPDVRTTRSMSSERQREAEGMGIKRLLRESDYVVLLDERGSERRSVEFASWLEHRLSATGRRLVFIVGGPYGFADEFYSMAHECLSLSKMTFSHQMVRLFFVEQLYRALTILRGEPYHHE